MLGKLLIVSVFIFILTSTFFGVMLAMYINKRKCNEHTTFNLVMLIVSTLLFALNLIAVIVLLILYIIRRIRCRRYTKTTKEQLNRYGQLDLLTLDGKQKVGVSINRISDGFSVNYDINEKLDNEIGTVTEGSSLDDSYSLENILEENNYLDKLFKNINIEDLVDLYTKKDGEINTIYDMIGLLISDIDFLETVINQYDRLDKNEKIKYKNELEYLRDYLINLFPGVTQEEKDEAYIKFLTVNFDDIDKEKSFYENIPN